MDVDDLDMRLLKTVQDGIELKERPYKLVGEKLGISEDEVLSRLQALIDKGVIRRFAATIGHRALGIVANAMIAWKVEQGDVDRAGTIMASFDEVTHCYERQSYQEWPYNLYTMVHSRDREECRSVARKISLASGISDYRILFSEREYKKTSARI